MERIEFTLRRYSLLVYCRHALCGPSQSHRTSATVKFSRDWLAKLKSAAKNFRRLAFDTSFPPIRFLAPPTLASSMDQYKASTPIPTAVSPPSSPSSSEPLNTSPPIRSDSEVTQGSSIPQVQPNASLEVAQAEEGGKDDDVERGSNSVSTTQDKGKGRAIGEALTDMGNGPEELARALAGFKMPEKGTLPLLLVSAVFSNGIS